jgi:hypothetical protein
VDPAGIPALVEAIRHMHSVEAKHVETAHVHEKAPTGETVWSGDVEVFEIEHPKTKRCFAWSEATTGAKRRFFAVLAVTPIDSAAMAVRASILADAQPKKS